MFVYCGGFKKNNPVSVVYNISFETGTITCYQFRPEEIIGISVKSKSYLIEYLGYHSS